MIFYLKKKELTHGEKLSINDYLKKWTAQNI